MNTQLGKNGEERSASSDGPLRYSFYVAVYLACDQIGAQKKKMVGTCFNNAEILQQILVSDALLSIEHIVNGRSVAAGLREQPIYACATTSVACP